MPKGNKCKFAGERFQYYKCGCGYTIETKGELAKIKIKLHNKCCTIGQNSIVVDSYCLGKLLETTSDTSTRQISLLKDKLVY